MELPQHFICSSLGHLLLSASSELFLNLPYLASWTASVSRVGTVVNTCYLPAEGLCTRGYQLAESSPCCLRLCPWISGPATSAPAGWRPGNGAASARAAILETESPLEEVPWDGCGGLLAPFAIPAVLRTAACSVSFHQVLPPLLCLLPADGHSSTSPCSVLTLLETSSPSTSSLLGQVSPMGSGGLLFAGRGVWFLAFI